MPIKKMEDGIYRVETNWLCAGFEVKHGRVVKIAPILKKRFQYWKKIAVKIETKNENRTQ